LNTCLQDDRYIAYAIFIPVIALILIPVIIIKFIEHHRAVRCNIKTVSKKLLCKIIVIATCLYFYGPAIFFKNVFEGIYPATTLHVNANRVFINVLL
jgi:hypothetical protein